VSATGVRLTIRRLDKAYGSRQVLEGVDLHVGGGEFLAVVGRSGCGKSTLLRVIAGLEAADAGRVLIDDLASTGAHPDVRMIFQESRLLPWSKVLSNVALGARAELKARRRATERATRANELLRNVGLADRALDWPSRLSGGQRQRVALARGLMSEPRLLLLDEPLGALDALTRLEMQELLERLWLEGGFTAVLVTHDIQEAVALADRVLVLQNGRVAVEVELGLTRPRLRESREFVETSARLLRHILEIRTSVPRALALAPQPSRCSEMPLEVPCAAREPRPTSNRQMDRLP
jgi:sulfonate transport system ATP-binding protein